MTTEDQPCTAYLLNGLIRWTVHQDDSVTLPIDAAGTAELVHPSVYDREQIRIDGGRASMVTSQLVLIGQEPPVEVIESILRRLRYIARQPELADELVGVAPGTIKLPVRVSVAGDAIQAARANPYYYRSALAWTDVEEALALPADHVTPIYEELLFQAIVASRHRDFRKAILYAAIAVESAAQHFCGIHYDAALKCSDKDIRLRLVEVTTHEGTHRKDPVFERLVSGAKFPTWLHEIPLYMLQRSLQLEDHELFRDAVELSKVRNKLAHSGPQVGNPATPELDWESTASAIDVATRTLTWFGVNRPFVYDQPGTPWIPVGG